MIENWQKSFDLVMKSEGGFSDDPRDTGNQMPDGRPGCTNLGVTMITWEMYVERKATIEEMKALTHKDVEPLYKRLFWDRVWGDKMPGGIDYLLFDFAVNAGVGRSVMCLQEAVGAHPDGGMGPLTFAATVTHDAADLIDKFSLAKEHFYRSLSNFDVYGKGWLNRVATVRIEADNMLNA
jgi:lysozyme family protein